MPTTFPQTILRGIRRMLAVAATGAVALLATALPPAPAGAATITACTNANQIVNVAFAYPVDLEVFTIRGWYPIPANGCITMPETSRNETHYFFAYTQNRDFTWPTATGRQFCLLGAKFTYPNWKDFMACPGGSEKRFFWPMNPQGGHIDIEFNY